MNLKENVNKIIFNWNIQTIKCVEIVRQNSLYLDYRNENEIFNIFKRFRCKKGNRN